MMNFCVLESVGKILCSFLMNYYFFGILTLWQFFWTACFLSFNAFLYFIFEFLMTKNRF